MIQNHDEDQIILAILEASGDEDLDRIGRDSESSEVRAYTEAVGLLPFALEPIAPPATAKERLLAAIAGAGASAERSEGTRPSISSQHPRFLERDRRSDRTEVPRQAANDNFRSFLVAATLACIMIGVAGWFYVQLEQQRETVASLQDELRIATERLQELSAGRRDVLTSLRGMALLTPEKIEVCPLRPPGDQPLLPRASGNLVLAKEASQWSLRVNGLEPASSGKVYVLWFFDQDRPIKKVNLGAGERQLEVNARGVPEMLTSIVVTLEASPEAERPTGPQVLYGDSREMYRL